jgi:hypothetical protein
MQIHTQLSVQLLDLVDLDIKIIHGGRRMAIDQFDYLEIVIYNFRLI